MTTKKMRPNREFRYRIYLSKEERDFLTKMLETDDPTEAAERFAMMMAREGADPTDLKKYINKIMTRMTKK